ncbi:helix-turn-helix domain-containing protein [Solwaraspora sp. WMMB335]|uniref:helix-turn-helix domain-containing protein n=1 Tax=Solwaraspora sp. WMMB335 TaxID=3404118 RepID=UPI003B9461F7
MVCSECGTGEQWNGRPLTLQVDHVDGRFWDCRPENLRLLCPNCHTQTANYAGRNRQRPLATKPITQPAPALPPRTGKPVNVSAVLRQVDDGLLGVSAAARLIGCHRNHVYRLRHRMAAESAGHPRQRRGRAAAHRDRVIAFALDNPDLGPKRLARELRAAGPRGCVISHGSVTRILQSAKLSTISARRAAAAAAAQHGQDHRDRAGREGSGHWDTLDSVESAGVA